MKTSGSSLLARTSLVVCLTSGLLAGCFNGSSSSSAAVEPPPAPEPTNNIFESVGAVASEQYDASLLIEPYGSRVRDTDEFALSIDDHASEYRSASTEWSLQVERQGI